MRGEHLELLRKVVASQKWSGEDSAWTGPTAPEWSLLADGLAFSQPTSYMCWGISSQKLAPLPTLPDTHRGNAWYPMAGWVMARPTPSLGFSLFIQKTGETGTSAMSAL